MEMKLTIYKDDTLCEIDRIVKADQLKIPYRVAMYIGQHLDNIEAKTTDDLFKFVLGSLDKVDKIVKATFGVTDEELECVDVAELGTVAIELYKWALSKINGINNGDAKNVIPAAKI